MTTHPLDEKLDKVRDLLVQYGERITRFEELGDRYFITLQQGTDGYSHASLIELYNDVLNAYEMATQMIESDQTESAAMILEFLSGKKLYSAANLPISIEKLNSLTDWQTKIELAIQKLGKEVDRVSSSLKQLGVQTTRTRKPTELCLTEAGVRLSKQNKVKF